MNRALQRMAGTVVGAVVAWLILAQNPGFGTVLACIVLFQFVTEIVIGFNYALGQIAVTPSALLMTHLAAPAAAVAGMPVERVMDTILGAALGIGFAVLFSTWTTAASWRSCGHGNRAHGTETGAETVAVVQACRMRDAGVLCPLGRPLPGAVARHHGVGPVSRCR
jgi:hypothetical protein